jgi:hypothetical protein
MGYKILDWMHDIRGDTSRSVCHSEGARSKMRRENKRKVTPKEVAQDMYVMFVKTRHLEHEAIPKAGQKFEEAGLELDLSWKALTVELCPINLLFLEVFTHNHFPLHAIEILEEFLYILKENWGEDVIDRLITSYHGYFEVWNEALNTPDPDATELLSNPVYRVTKLACQRVIDDDSIPADKLMATHYVVQGVMAELLEMFEDYSKRHEVVRDPENNKEHIKSQKEAKIDVEAPAMEKKTSAHICEKCGCSDFEYDDYWNEYTCEKCGWIEK